LIPQGLGVAAVSSQKDMFFQNNSCRWCRLSARETVCQIIRSLSAKKSEQGYRVKFTIALNQSSGGEHQYGYHLSQHLSIPRDRSWGCRQRRASDSPWWAPRAGDPLHEIPDENFRMGAVSPQNSNESGLHCTVQSAPCPRGQRDHAHGVGDAGAMVVTLTVKLFRFRSRRSGYIAGVDQAGPLTLKAYFIWGRTCRDIPGISQSPHHIFDRVLAVLGLIAKAFHGAE
jgi:hypothetical protein